MIMPPFLFLSQRQGFHSSCKRRVEKELKVDSSKAQVPALTTKAREMSGCTDSLFTKLRR